MKAKSDTTSGFTHLERSVAFQKFLMEFSVRPGSRLVILLQWLPTSAWHCASRNSSSGDQFPLQRYKQQQQQQRSRRVQQ